MLRTEHSTRLFRRLAELLPVLFLLLVALYFGSNLFSPVRFDRERIEVWAFDRQTQVTGLYHYVNRSPLPLSFSFGLPFPVDRDHPPPAAFFVSEVHADGTLCKEIATRDYHGETTFRLWFWPSQDKWIRVDYLQKTAVPQARYILLTTRQWRAPLDRGDYLLHLCQGCDLVSSNYPVSRVPGTQNNYAFFRTDFLPSEDWQFSWRSSRTSGAGGGGQP